MLHPCSGRTVPLFVLALAVLASTAHAETTPERPTKGVPSVIPKPRAPLAGRGEGPSRAAPSGSARGDTKREKMQERLEKLRQRVEAKRAQSERLRTLAAEVDEGLRQGDVNAEALREKLDQLAAARAERRRDHRATLRARWGDGLALPGVKAELEQHGRRMARLRRMQYLAATERTGEPGRALLNRIQRLIDSEQARHSRSMQELGAGKAVPAPSGTAAAVEGTQP